MTMMKLYKTLRSALFTVAVLTCVTLLAPTEARAQYSSCVCNGCVAAEGQTTREYIRAEFQAHREWLLGPFFENRLVPAMMMMTEQLTVVGLQQVQIIGTFFDAKMQLETQRLFQQLQAEAHKDYHPSQGICSFGTNIQSLAASERKADINAIVLSERLLDRQLNAINSLGGEGNVSDKVSRLNQFISNYCDPNDNNGGLRELCSGPGARPNRDVDYTRTIDSALTLNADFSSNGAATPDEADIMAMSANLYAHETFDPLPSELIGNPGLSQNYLDVRAVAAKRSVAQNSFNNIVGMKTAGSGNSEYLQHILTELGIEASDAKAIVGDNPSYYAQMEMLAKKIYQNPDFYTNLYDKPANVARKGVAMQAISLIQERDLFKSQLRTEAMLSLILELELEKKQAKVQNELTGNQN